MNLFGSDDDIQNSEDQALQYEQEAYNNSANLLSPYTQNAGTDFNNGRQAIYDAGGKLIGYGNPATGLWNQIGEDPTTMYEQDMANYTMSAGAQNEMAAEEMAANNAAAASGQIGGTNNMVQDEQIAESVTSQDEQQYFNDVQKERGNQLSYLDDLRNVQSTLLKTFQSMIGREYGASNQLSQAGLRAAQEAGRDEMEAGRYESQNDSGLLKDAGNLLGGLVGAGASIYDNNKLIKAL